MKIAFLGPEASYTHQTALKLFKGFELIPQKGIFDCFQALLNEEVDKAVVPLENSIGGTVAITLDHLFEVDGINIEAEAVLPIKHQLMIHPQQENEVEIEKIYSHPQALAQTFLYLNKYYGNVPQVQFSSTSAAAKKVASEPHRKLAAVANKLAAEQYGLKIIASEIQDREKNETRFIIISKKPTSWSAKYPKRKEKNSLIITMPEDHSGGLHQVLSAFAWRKLNLTKIESRTMKTGLDNYFFFINVDSEGKEVIINNAIEELHSIGMSVKKLGHYPEFIL